MEEYNIPHRVFIMLEFAYTKVPVTTVAKFLKNTRDTKNADSTIEHYQLLI